MKMKIVYLHQYFNTPEMTGGTRSYEMAKRMVAAGHEVHIVTSSTDGRMPAGQWTRDRIDGIHVHWLPVSYDNTMGYMRRLISFTQFARQAGRYAAAAIDADIVFATSTPLTIAFPAVKVSRSQKIPMVFEVRDLWPEVPIAMGALNFPFAKTLAKRLEKWAYDNAKHVVGLSPGMCDGVARTGYPRDRIHCIPNSSDIDLFNVPESEGIAFRAKRDWLESRPLVLYAGTFGKVNGVGYLVEVAAAMSQIDPEVRFLAVGRGLEVQSVRERARSLGVLERNFFIEDAVPKAEMPALLSAATVSLSLVIPLKELWDNSANKFFDTLAAGRPIAVNHGGWQAELIRNTGIGIVLDHADPAAAANSLHAFLDDSTALKNARQASASLARERFSRNKLATELINVLEEAYLDGHSSKDRLASERVRGEDK
ncbi:glycosyltransferase family 4 protein [Aquamicrobium lusatiense]|uniref:glycosyltransferase family 4 protein n=1 Tax=Aquamicrobium lusatiense TaxID=89772 RepID=UPI00245626EA|nr:glycosyltransferase family 4 protein [Aquamicrobium lusatiense]MDH4992794.1 glycosyltransferase family 4 protein [Aquamicrobium lusatiense]